MKEHGKKKMTVQDPGGDFMWLLFSLNLLTVVLNRDYTKSRGEGSGEGEQQ